MKIRKNIPAQRAVTAQGAVVIAHLTKRLRSTPSRNLFEIGLGFFCYYKIWLSRR